MNGIIILIAKSNGNRLLKRKVRKLAREAQVDADVVVPVPNSVLAISRCSQFPNKRVTLLLSLN
jgi:hypothetical protein